MACGRVYAAIAKHAYRSSKMTLWKKKTLVAATLSSMLIAGAALALPADGWEITYYDAQGNIVGESTYLCGSRIYRWGQVTSIYDRIDFPCN
jgi:Family of unknown function (DUF6289)